MSEQIEWEGYVERITFRNEENGYTVLFLVDAEEEEEVCCVGQFSYVAEGLYLKVTGREVIHKNYGTKKNNQKTQLLLRDIWDQVR